MFFEVQAGLFLASDNFADTFVSICFIIIRESKIFNCQTSFKMLLSMWLVIVESEL